MISYTKFKLSVVKKWLPSKMVFRRSILSFWTLPRHYLREFCTSHPSHVELSPQFSSRTVFATCIHRATQQKCAETQHGGVGPQTIERKFSKYASPSQDSFYFDTHMMVTDLHKCGFSFEQSEVITAAITDVVHSSVESVKGNSVSRVEQEQLEVRLKSLIEKVRNDMIILEKTEFVRMKDECEKLKSEVASLKFLLQEEVVKLKSSQALDTSLERSRVKEEFQFRDQKIKDNNNRIDTEVARVETKIEAQKLDLLKYLVGSVLSLCTIVLAFWRFFKM